MLTAAVSQLSENSGMTILHLNRQLPLTWKPVLRGLRYLTGYQQGALTILKKSGTQVEHFQVLTNTAGPSQIHPTYHQIGTNDSGYQNSMQQNMFYVWLLTVLGLSVLLLSFFRYFIQRSKLVVSYLFNAFYKRMYEE